MFTKINYLNDFDTIKENTLIANLILNNYCQSKEKETNKKQNILNKPDLKNIIDKNINKYDQNNLCSQQTSLNQINNNEYLKKNDFENGIKNQSKFIQNKKNILKNINGYNIHKSPIQSGKRIVNSNSKSVSVAKKKSKKVLSQSKFFGQMKKYEISILNRKKLKPNKKKLIIKRKKLNHINL